MVVEVVASLCNTVRWTFVVAVPDDYDGHGQYLTATNPVPQMRKLTKLPQMIIIISSSSLLHFCRSLVVIYLSTSLVQLCYSKLNLPPTDMEMDSDLVTTDR